MLPALIARAIPRIVFSSAASSELGERDLGESGLDAKTGPPAGPVGQPSLLAKPSGVGANKLGAALSWQRPLILGYWRFPPP